MVSELSFAVCLSYAEPSHQANPEPILLSGWQGRPFLFTLTQSVSASTAKINLTSDNGEPFVDVISTRGAMTGSRSALTHGYPGRNQRQRGLI